MASTINAFQSSLSCHHSPVPNVQQILRINRYHLFPLYQNERSSFSNLSVPSPASQLILQTFRCFTYLTAHSLNLPLFHLRHSSFYNPSFASPTSPGEPPMFLIPFTPFYGKFLFEISKKDFKFTGIAQ